ncbi:universal stress protein UspA [Halalkaliarchaeum desulfuricum]|uniref:Universal stress protein UspA n=1 Tax=Halalkaliarchaeum desulfuricum TaxID=2055893 RepID=A0A343TIZ9_9EURY|nr:universal stress protein [Halalkaliarchaeum desulfuricum]AUX09071.1 universal stress protein UspA [Halalkaliarchaeum desulfuricum]
MGQHVLVPIDGSDTAWKALDVALGLFPEGELSVLHVIGPMGIDTDADGGVLDSRAYDRAKEDARELETEAKDRIADADSPAPTLHEIAIEVGDPAREILDYAEANDVDHVVMGSRGRSSIERLLLGSVSETVTRRAPMSVTVVR